MEEPSTPPDRNAFARRPPRGPEPADDVAPAAPLWLPEILHSATLIDIAAERGELEIDPVLDRLDQELVGLAPVKTRVHQIAAFLTVDRLRFRYGLTSSRPTLHMCFTGGPGTGKATVARRTAEILKGLGYLDRGHLVTVTRNELVGRSTPRTKEVLKRSLGGVLFIDEPYSRGWAENEGDDGDEAIKMILEIMEQREDLVVILAGDKDRMDSFFQSNPDMSWRIAHHIDFPEYTIDELCNIAERMLADQRYEFSPEGREAFRRYLVGCVDRFRFANARSVRDALERARLRQANRIISRGGRCSRQDLMRIEPDDILAGRAMADGPPESHPTTAGRPTRG